MKQIIERARALAGDNGAATAPEFAIVSTVFLTFIMAIAYLGLMLFTYSGVHWAVENAARVAEVNTSASKGDIQKAINSNLESIGLPDATSVSYSTTNTPFQISTVTATLTQTYAVPLISTVTITFSATTQIPQAF